MPDGRRADARRQLDAAVRSFLGMPEADCPEVWEAVKARRAELDVALARREGER
jgi:hypothetical protein